MSAHWSHHVICCWYHWNSPHCHWLQFLQHRETKFTANTWIAKKLFSPWLVSDHKRIGFHHTVSIFVLYITVWLKVTSCWGVMKKMSRFPQLAMHRFCYTPHVLTKQFIHPLCSRASKEKGDAESRESLQLCYTIPGALLHHNQMVPHTSSGLSLSSTDAKKASMSTWNHVRLKSRLASSSAIFWSIHLHTNHKDELPRANARLSLTVHLDNNFCQGIWLSQASQIQT